MNDKKFWKGFGTGLLAFTTCLLLLILATTLTGTVDWRQVLPGTKGSVLGAGMERKIREIQAYVDIYYLDDVDQKEMEDSICNGILEGLGDKYAAYYNEEAYEELTEKTSGNYCGIGAYVSQNATTGAITIIQPIEGSPAKKAGLQSGDIISKVDNKDISGKDLSEVVSLMKGEPGTKVKLQIVRTDEKKPLDVTIVRAEIESETVKYQMLDGKIGYIGVSAFEEVTKEQFRGALDDLESRGEKSLIIDLRDNGGGLLATAVDMLDRMLPEGVVVYTKDKSGKKEEYYSDGKESFDKPVAILVNENSASASEVFSGAMQDYGKAALVGTTTFGKGIVQSVFDLSDGTAIKLTTSKYYTPKGRNIHGTGLEPDVRVELNDKFIKQTKSGLDVDNQLYSAMKYLKKK